MAHVDPLNRDALNAQFEEIFQMVEGAMGFVPNSMLTMARRPELLGAFAGFAGAVQRHADLDPVLLQLVAHVTSTAAGCSYCQAHTGAVAERRGASSEALEDVWNFETSERFSPADRAALRLARDAGVVPNAVGKEHFDNLREHFSEEQIVDLVAVISLFGFLNRWNDTMATTLEDEPRSFGDSTLASRGWSVNKHA